MSFPLTSRALRQRLGNLFFALVLTAPAVAQIGPPPRPLVPTPTVRNDQLGQEHLAQWMSRHSNLTLPDQQRALEREPGFRELAPDVQQRMRERLTELNRMPPEKRERVLARTEAMERLNPQQRQEVRGAMSQLASLPPDQRRAVAQAFRELRTLPPAQRMGALNSDRFRGGFSEQQRSTLSNLLSIEPYLPPPTGIVAPTR